MQIGVLMFVTGRSLPVTELAGECEARGIESLWVPEHPVVPAVYETRYPLSEDGKMPRRRPRLGCVSVRASVSCPSVTR